MVRPVTRLATTWSRTAGGRAVVASWMERDLSKKRIIEIYLNVIEWGDGVYGCEAAARRYLGKPVMVYGDAEFDAAAADGGARDYKAGNDEKELDAEPAVFRDGFKRGQGYRGEILGRGAAKPIMKQNDREGREKPQQIDPRHMVMLKR